MARDAGLSQECKGPWTPQVSSALFLDTVPGMAPISCEGRGLMPSSDTGGRTTEAPHHPAGDQQLVSHCTGSAWQKRKEL